MLEISGYNEAKRRSSIQDWGFCFTYFLAYLLVMVEENY